MLGEVLPDDAESGVGGLASEKCSKPRLEEEDPSMRLDEGE